MTSGKNTGIERWLAVEQILLANVPQLSAVLGSEEAFISLYVKIRDDRTMLAVLKRYGSDGGMLVCFGTGYGVAGCFMGLEGSIAANKWKVDEPWPGKGK